MLRKTEVAYVLLGVAAQADGGCLPCVQSGVDFAVWKYPDLPYDEALERFDEPTRVMLTEAVVAARATHPDQIEKLSS